MISSQVNRSCLKFCLHDPEAFFDFLPFLVDPDDIGYIVLKVRANRIEPVVFHFVINSVLIQ